jgi:hypothetical protein
MTLFFYAKVNPNNTILTLFQQDHEIGEHNTRANSASNGKPFILPVVLVPEPSYDIDSQVLEPAAYDVQTTQVVQVWTVRAMTAAEQAVRDEEKAAQARRNVPRQGEGLPDVRAELDALKQTLFDQGVLTGT